PSVEQVPEFGALVLRIPLAKLIAMGEKTLLGAGLLLVTTRATEAGVETEFLDRVEQRHRLERVARGIRSLFLLGAAGLDRIGHVTHHEAAARFVGELVAKSDGLVE